MSAFFMARGRMPIPVRFGGVLCHQLKTRGAAGHLSARHAQLMISVQEDFFIKHAARWIRRPTQHR